MSTEPVLAIDMHNHLIAPEVADFLTREGEKYATQFVEQDGQRFFVIQGSARRPYHDKIARPEARLPDMDAASIGVQAVSCVPFLMYPEVAPDLGLAIAQDIVKCHGSKIRVASRSGRGTEFSFSLPKQEQPSQGASMQA